MAKKVLNGRDLKKLVANIPDDALVVVGVQGDKMGRNDASVICLEKRQIGFDNNDMYYVVCIEPYTSNGTLKFYE